MAKKPREETRKVSDLKPHPFAQKVLGDPPLHEVADLAEDMKKNGQRDAIDILADGTIINGLTRWLAAKMAGITDLRVVVHELDDTAAKRFILEANLLRHHYSKLVIARICVELKKLARGRGKKAPPGEGDLRDRLAKRFNISGRTLDNLEAMLGAPEEVQDVYQRGDLSDGAILAVAKLSADLKKELVAKLKDSGADKEGIIKQFLANNKPKSDTSGKNAVNKFAPKSTTKGNTKASAKTTGKSDTNKVDSKANANDHDGITPETPAGPVGANRTPWDWETPVEPEAAAEGPADIAVSATATAVRASETVKVAETIAAEPVKVLTPIAAESAEGDDPVETYHAMLDELPSAFDKLVDLIDEIAGAAMESEAAVAALQRIAASVQTLIEAENALAEVAA